MSGVAMTVGSYQCHASLTGLYLENGARAVGSFPLVFLSAVGRAPVPSLAVSDRCGLLCSLYYYISLNQARSADHEEVRTLTVLHPDPGEHTRSERAVWCVALLNSTVIYGQFYGV